MLDVAVTSFALAPVPAVTPTDVALIVVVLPAAWASSACDSMQSDES